MEWRISKSVHAWTSCCWLLDATKMDLLTTEHLTLVVAMWMERKWRNYVWFVDGMMLWDLVPGTAAGGPHFWTWQLTGASTTCCWWLDGDATKWRNGQSRCISQIYWLLLRCTLWLVKDWSQWWWWWWWKGLKWLHKWWYLLPLGAISGFVLDAGAFVRFHDVDADGEVVKMCLELLGLWLMKLRHHIFITRQKHKAKRSIMRLDHGKLPWFGHVSFWCHMDTDYCTYLYQPTHNFLLLW